MSTDAAHSLSDALGRDLRAGAGEPVAVEPRLDALQVVVPQGGDGSWRVVQDYLLDVLGSLDVDPVVAEELTSLPGAEEVTALLELRTRAGSDHWDLIVVDCAPTAETLRLLALPEALAWHLERLVPAQRRLMRTLRPAAAAAAGLPLPDASVAAAVTGWYHQMREVQALLTSPATSVRLVLTPERVVIAESRRTWTSLSLYGYVVDQVVVNRIFPDAHAGVRKGARVEPFLHAWNQAQAEGLAEVHESFGGLDGHGGGSSHVVSRGSTAAAGGLPVVTTPFLPYEPIGPDALSELGLPVDPEALLAPVERAGMSVRRREGGYTLRLPLPLASSREVDLKRRDAELLVAVGDHRRVLTLPSALQRCVVTGARVAGGTLSVDFVPDIEQWPRDLGQSMRNGSSRKGSQQAVSTQAASRQVEGPRNGRAQGAPDEGLRDDQMDQSDPKEIAGG